MEEMAGFRRSGICKKGFGGEVDRWTTLGTILITVYLQYCNILFTGIPFIFILYMSYHMHDRHGAQLSRNASKGPSLILIRLPTEFLL